MNYIGIDFELLLVDYGLLDNGGEVDFFNFDVFSFGIDCCYSYFVLWIFILGVNFNF